MNTAQYRRVRLSNLDHQAAQLKRRFGKDRAGWPPEAETRLHQIDQRRRRVLALMGEMAEQVFASQPREETTHA